MSKALIIDDSSTVRSIIAKFLKDWGMPNLQAGNGQEAFDTLQKSDDITIAFVDWNMPIMNGIDFVKLVRADEKYNGVKLVMVTTETEMPQIARALESGVDEYIMKPFTKEIFHDKLSIIGIKEVKDN